MNAPGDSRGQRSIAETAVVLFVVALVAAMLFHTFILLSLSPTLELIALTPVMGTGFVLFAAEPWAQSGRERATPA